jgi:hypothetical protein
VTKELPAKHSGKKELSSSRVQNERSAARVKKRKSNSDSLKQIH